MGSYFVFKIFIQKFVALVCDLSLQRSAESGKATLSNKLPQQNVNVCLLA